VDLRHMDEKLGSNVVDVGVDLSEFYMSVEWDILEVPAVTLSISILISLHVFFLLVVEIIPPTSLVVPLLGKYLIFAMILVSIRYTSGRVLMRTVRGKEKTCYYPYHPSTQEDSEEHLTPKRFHSRPPSKEDLSPSSLTDGARFGGSCMIHGPPLPPLPLHTECEDLSVSGDAGIEEVKSPALRSPPAFSHSRCPPEVHKSCICVRFIAEHTKMLEDSTKVKEDWKYVAMVLDRLFLWIFTLAVLVGTAGIILQAPTLYDDRVPIDKKFSEFATTTVVKCPPQ
ncbi:hypothetical protein P5V15_009425, partial [Pogonomyrmex californicus]